MHVELGVPEDERVALVDHRDVDLVAELLRQGRRELEAAESRSENDDPRLHRAIIVSRPRVTPDTGGIRRPGNRVGPGMQQTPTERSRRRIPIVPIVIVAILCAHPDRLSHLVRWRRGRRRLLGWNCRPEPIAATLAAVGSNNRRWRVSACVIALALAGVLVGAPSAAAVASPTPAAAEATGAHPCGTVHAVDETVQAHRRHHGREPLGARSGRRRPTRRTRTGSRRSAGGCPGPPARPTRASRTTWPSSAARSRRRRACTAPRVRTTSFTR